MGVEPLKKVYLFTTPGHREELLKFLQHSGVVQLTADKGFLPENEDSLFEKICSDLSSRMGSLARRLENVRGIIEVLEPLEGHKGILSPLIQPREITTPAELGEIAGFDESTLYQRLQYIDREENASRTKIQHNRYLIGRLRFMAGVDVRLEELQDTSKTFSRTGLVPNSDWPAVRSRLEEYLGEASHLQELGGYLNYRIVLVTGLLDRLAGFSELEENLPLEVLPLEGLEASPRVTIRQLEGEIERLERDEKILDEERRALIPRLPKLRKLHDYCTNEIERLEKISCGFESRYTSLFAGWIPARNIPDLKTRLFDTAVPIHLWLQDPAPEDIPPVEYQNRPLVNPFEFVTDLYSRPRYWEIDPTPFMSAFFALFYGICLTDAGYGLLTVLLTYIILKKLTPLPESSRKLMKILFLSGMVTTVFGFFTGGFFGLSFHQLPGFLANLGNLVIMDPQKDQMSFLIFALALGVIHVTFGIYLRFRWILTHGSREEAWLDQAPWLAILLGFVVLILARVVENVILSGFGYLLSIGGALVILIFAGRTSRNPAVRFGLGLFKLYNVTTLLGDVLSYARLFALGIATGVIAGVVNFMAGLTLGIPYLGYILMPVLLISGHLVNLLVNSLGGFIHTTRLQFVEFFGKFYEGGGEPFEPFKLNLKYSAILEQRERE